MAAGLSYGPARRAAGCVASSSPGDQLRTTDDRRPQFRPGSARAGYPVPEPPSGLNGHGHAAAELFATELARGEIPGIRRIRREMHLGQPRAQQVREYLAELART